MKWLKLRKKIENVCKRHKKLIKFVHIDRFEKGIQTETTNCKKKFHVRR